MKIKSLYVAALIVFAAAVTAVGKDDPSTGLAVIPVKGSEVFKVIYKGESPSKVKLNVYNSFSQIVFSETMNSVDGFIRPLNFKGLQFGEYSVELTDASGKQVEKINYQPTKSESVIHVSKLADADGKFLLSVSKSNNQLVTVRIYDEANHLVHSDSNEVSEDFARLYTLKDIQGAVTFEISDNAGNTQSVTF
jgi:hypothetical protein